MKNHVRNGRSVIPIKFLLCFGLVVGWVNGGMSADLDPQVVGTWKSTKYEIRGLAIQGDYAFCAEGSRWPTDGHYGGLNILDLRDKTQPRQAGIFYLDLAAEDITVSGAYAYLANGSNGLQVFDITQPENPQRLGGCATDSFACGVAIAGGYAYVAARSNGLQVVDVSDPAHPQLVGRYEGSQNAYRVAVSGDYAYLADGTNGLQVLDISDRENPRLVSHYKEQPSQAFYCVAVSGRYVCIGNLKVLDTSNPANPRVIGSYTNYVAGQSVFISGSYAYVVTHGFLRVLELSPTNNPRSVARFPRKDWQCDAGCISGCVAVSGNYAYLSDGYGLQVIDIANLANPQRAGNFPASPRAVAVSEPYAYLADPNGLRVMDISNPSALREAGFYKTNPGRCVAISGNYVYLTTDTQLISFDVTNPASPKLVVINTNTSPAQDIAIVGNYLYLAEGRYGLEIFNISRPGYPWRVDYYGPAAGCLAVAGNFMYTVDGSTGWQVLDISVPTYPRRVGSCITNGLVDLALSGQYVYGATTKGLQIIDIADPLNAKLLGAVTTRIIPNSVAVVGNYAYLLGDISLADPGEKIAGLEVIDVSDPSNPRRVGGNKAFYGQVLANLGDKLMVTDVETGMTMLNLFAPGPALSLNASPGPGPDTFSLSVRGIPGVPVELERSSDFSSWQRWTNLTLGANPLELTDSVAGETSRRFYRATAR